MSLMERVSALIRANLNDLVDQAEDPEKMLKQVILDMENQLIQVKTQVAIAIADEHLLVKKQKENSAKQAEWMRKAELAVEKQDDPLARALDTARLIAANAPLAVAGTRRAVREQWAMDLPAAYANQSRIAAQVMKSEDAAEGARAFTERRPPRFRGR